MGDVVKLALLLDGRDTRLKTSTHLANQRVRTITIKATETFQEIATELGQDGRDELKFHRWERAAVYGSAGNTGSNDLKGAC